MVTMCLGNVTPLQSNTRTEIRYDQGNGSEPRRATLKARSKHSVNWDTDSQSLALPMTSSIAEIPKLIVTLMNKAPYP